jgi:hypothetical protein
LVSSLEEELAVDISHQHDECEDSVMAEASDTIVEVNIELNQFIYLLE